MSETIRNFVDGELVESAATDFIELVDPTTGEVDGRSPVSTSEEVDRAYAAALRASASWKRLTPGRRQAHLLDLATAIAHLKEFRATWNPGDVIDEESGLTADDLDCILARLASDE